MRVIIVFCLLLIITGCQSKVSEAVLMDDRISVPNAIISNEAKDKAVLSLLKLDSGKGFKVKTKEDTLIIIENTSCQVSVHLQDGKTSKITSVNIDKSEYNCIFRTLIKDVDLIGQDKDKYDKFIALFREKEEFDFENINIKRSDTSLYLTRR